MKFSPLDNSFVPLYKKTLKAYSARHTAIAENISNIDTKGYKPYRVTFEEELMRSIDKNRPQGLKSHAKHMDIGRKPIEIKMQIKEHDEFVNIEKEMADLAENQIRFDLVSLKLSSMYKLIQTAIKGRA